MSDARVTPPPPPADDDDATTTSVTRAPLLRPLLRLPMKKIAIWAAFLLLLWVLRPFFGLVFLTFVLAYISSSIVERISPHFTSRRVPVILVFAGIVGAVVGLGVATVPRAIRESHVQLKRLSARDLDDPKRFIDVQMSRALGGQPIIEGAAMVKGSMFGAVFGDKRRRGETPGFLSDIGDRLAEPAVSEQISILLRWVRDQKLIPGLKLILEGTMTGVIFTLLALLFSFMIVWDAPKIAAAISRLRDSRLGDAYVQVAPSIATFARLLGRAFEAQTLIALVNTFLTAAGMLALGIKGIGLLSTIVFICSFIPIAGVFISTVPICLVALTQDDGGILLVVGVVVMVTIVHIIEAYILNPRIYGHHMKLHPLAVLVVLYLGQHLVGLWGLIIGVPLATYVWRHVIMGEAEHIQEPPRVILDVPVPPPPSLTTTTTPPTV